MHACVCVCARVRARACVCVCFPAIASSLSTVNSLTKEVERLKMLIAAEDPKYEQLVQEIFDNVNILNNGTRQFNL